MSGTVAIIGAGMAGLAAARILASAGVACVIFDKSRGLGGRMATRRVDGLQFDHGAQYFSCRGERFAALVSHWRAAGAAAEWFEGAFVGAPAMTAPARSMAADLEVLVNFEVRDLRRTGSGWTVHGAGPAADPAGRGPFSDVLFALPAPQIAPILARADVAFPGLDAVRYAPCWALMLAYGRMLDLPWTHLRPEGGEVAWIARNGTKPGRDAAREAIVVHAGSDWSTRRLECAPEEAVAELLAHFRALTGVMDEPVFAASHRWRYALVQEPAGAPFFWDEAARVGACGDWCLGPRVEAAFDSGEAAARALIARRRGGGHEA